ncbi:MAG: phage holin family protein [Muribaculaceae bacterium]|nr:phage holin family protein [Muribaculaceae bacterium]
MTGGVTQDDTPPAMTMFTDDMNEIDYKKLFGEARKYFSLEWDYTKLTAVEKLAVLLSSIAFVGVVLVIVAFALQFLFSALISLLASALGCTWGAQLIAVGILMLLLLVVFAFKRQLIVDPVARFVSKLFLKPEDNE